MESYEQKYKAALEWMQGMYGGLHGKTKEEAEKYFTELKESKDEMIREKLIEFFKDWGKRLSHCWGLSIPDILSWLEKQGEPKQEENDQKCEPFRIKKGKWYVCIHDFLNKAIRIGEIIQAEHDDTIRGIGFLYMENKYFRPAFENEIPQKPKWTDENECPKWFEKQGEKPQSKTALEAVKEISPAESLGISPEKYEEIVNECIYGSDNEQILSNSAKTCKNDTLLDLLRKIPSCITLDGIDYHFVMKKTSYYIACYNGNGEEGRGNAIFGVTAYSPIDLLTEMLEELKEEGLLE